MTTWNSLTLYCIDSIDADGRYVVAGHTQRPITHDYQPERYEGLLREYRSTGGIAGHVFELPEDGTPEAMERACEAGPSVDEIDWAGLD